MRVLYPVSSAGAADEALRLAIDLVRTHGGEVRGLFVVDEPGIRRSEAGAPPGAIRMAREAEAKIVSREAAAGERRVAAIAEACRAAGVAFSGSVAAGDPHREIVKLSASCDLLVCGLDAHFAYRDSDEPCDLALRLMKERAAPVLLAAGPYRPVRTAVLGCGGGERSSRAAAAMARLALWKGRARIILLAVAATAEEGEAHLAAPRRILSEAGYPAPEEKVLTGPKIERFIAFCEEEGADAVVLGGWGEHRWDDLLGLSITGSLIVSGRHHLFLYM